jgi:DNA polymerase-4
MTLGVPTYLASDINAAALELIAKHWAKRKPIRTLTVTAENLLPAGEAEHAQLSLFDEFDAPQSDKQERLELALDSIRSRYGKHSVQPAAILRNDLGLRETDAK